MIRNFNDHAANERTFLAWVRTAMATVGFGLATARLQQKTPETLTEFALTVTGGLVILLAFLRMKTIKKRIDISATVEDDEAVGDTLLVLIVISFFALMSLFFVQVA